MVDDVILFVEQGEVVGCSAPTVQANHHLLYDDRAGDGRAGKHSRQRPGRDQPADVSPRRLGLGYLPQEPSIFRKLSAEQNILAVLETMKLARADRFALSKSS